jgi:hypothetical protein
VKTPSTRSILPQAPATTTSTATSKKTLCSSLLIYVEKPSLSTDSKMSFCPASSCRPILDGCTSRDLTSRELLVLIVCWRNSTHWLALLLLELIKSSIPCVPAHWGAHARLYDGVHVPRAHSPHPSRPYHTSTPQKKAAVRKKRAVRIGLVVGGRRSEARSRGRTSA